MRRAATLAGAVIAAALDILAKMTDLQIDDTGIGARGSNVMDG